MKQNMPYYFLKGDIVLWEEWAGPQVIRDMHYINNGDILFADLAPLDENSKSIGHDVPVDHLTFIKSYENINAYK